MSETVTLTREAALEIASHLRRAVATYNQLMQQSGPAVRGVVARPPRAFVARAQALADMLDPLWPPRADRGM